jgi:hypothetical protein
VHRFSVEFFFFLCRVVFISIFTGEGEEERGREELRATVQSATLEVGARARTLFSCLLLHEIISRGVLLNPLRLLFLRLRLALHA